MKKMFLEQNKNFDIFGETTIIFKMFYILFEMTDSKKNNQLFLCLDFWKFMTEFLLSKSGIFNFLNKKFY